MFFFLKLERRMRVGGPQGAVTKVVPMAAYNECARTSSSKGCVVVMFWLCVGDVSFR